MFQANSLADPGGVPDARPQGSRFFHFDIKKFQNVTASGVHAPLRGQRPPAGNPGSATDNSGNRERLSHNTRFPREK